MNIKHIIRSYKLTIAGKLLVFFIAFFPLAYTVSHYINTSKSPSGPVVFPIKLAEKDKLNPKFKQVKVNTDGSVLFIRQSPSIDAPVLAAMPNKTICQLIRYSSHTDKIEGRKGLWCEVIYQKGSYTYQGWAWGHHLILLN